MRRVFYTLGVAFVVIVVVVIAFVGVAAYRGSRLDAESKTYVDQAIVDIGKNWNRTELLKRASPNLLSQTSADQITTLFQQLAKFGTLVHYDGANGQATMLYSVGGVSTVRAHYEANATFENGPAHFRIDLSKNNEQWMIDGFWIDLSPPAANPARQL